MTNIGTQDSTEKLQPANDHSELCSKCEKEEAGLLARCDYEVEMSTDPVAGDEDCALCNCCSECRSDCFMST